MKRLPNNFSSVLDKIGKIKNLGKESSYKEVNKNYNKIDKKFKESECYVPDIEKTLAKYKQDDKRVDALRILKDSRNEELYKLATKSSKLTKLAKKIVKDYSPNFESKISETKVVSILKKLLQKRCRGWTGPWTILELNNNGTIKNIELFDSNDKTYVFRELCKRYKKK
uniref:Uncharacterized protein n=1 Tax=viral metagenome TaxID=1070528 RepID=A0A6C0ADE0_9ZZZZ